MKEFFVVWFYIANHGMERVNASSGLIAVEYVLEMYSDDFKQKAQLAVFDSQPVFSHRAHRMIPNFTHEARR